LIEISLFVAAGILFGWLLFELIERNQRRKRRRQFSLEKMQLELEHFNMEMRALNEQTRKIIPLKKREKL
jgi:uncharacterized membrane-anchored protein YhcB (DUF1043 family)